MNSMRIALLTLLLSSFVSSAQVIPRNNPVGTWQAETGTQYQIQGSTSELKVEIVPGTNPRFLEYEVDLRNTGEVNSYKGTGHFVAKMPTGKECRLETEWEIIVVQPDQIVGATSNITANPDTCEIVENGRVRMELKRKT